MFAKSVRAEAVSFTKEESDPLQNISSSVSGRSEGRQAWMECCWGDKGRPARRWFWSPPTVLKQKWGEIQGTGAKLG